MQVTITEKQYNRAFKKTQKIINEKWFSTPWKAEDEPPKDIEEWGGDLLDDFTETFLYQLEIYVED